VHAARLRDSLCLLFAAACLTGAAPVPVAVPVPVPLSAANAPPIASPPPPIDAAAKDANPGPISSTAKHVYADARPRLLQVRTLLSDTGQQTTLGSAFLVDADGLAITNYHVVSQFALEPKTYKMEYAAPDGSHGPLTLVAFDVGNDLAVVRLDKHDLPFFTFNPAALSGESLKGERLYSMGNPLDLGFAIVEGTYNGLVDHSYNERIHFSGAINAGMSGGPTVTEDSRVIGINVAKLISGELVSFLVPARFAVPLIERARSGKPLSLPDVRAEIARQLSSWQDGLYSTMGHADLPLSTFGPYKAPESGTNWFTCWARTNADDVPKPRAVYNSTRCDMNVEVFISEEVNTGSISFTHTYVKSGDLNPFQFTAFVNTNRLYDLEIYGDNSDKYFSPRLCREDFVAPQTPEQRPLMRVVWCAQAYRDFEGVYDVSMMVATQDRNREMLLSNLSMKGVSYVNATAFAHRFLEAIQWSR